MPFLPSNCSLKEAYPRALYEVLISWYRVCATAEVPLYLYLHIARFLKIRHTFSFVLFFLKTELHLVTNKVKLQQYSLGIISLRYIWKAVKALLTQECPLFSLYNQKKRHDKPQ